MSQTTNDSVVRGAVDAASVAPIIGLEHSAGQHGMVVVDLLAGHRQTELVEPAEGVEIRGRESSVGHVEVFQVAGVGTSIIGRPRPSPRHQRAAIYTLICEEPVIAVDGQSVGSRNLADNELFLHGLVEASDHDGVLTLRVADAIVLIATTGEPPFGVVGRHISVVVRDAEIFPTHV